MPALQLGTRIPGLPIPAIDAATSCFAAGSITIGVEYRRLDADVFRASLVDKPEQMEELTARIALDDFSDEGVSIHVFATAGGAEHLRFDVFVDEPHYHYIYPGENLAIPFDVAAGGEMLAWTLGCLEKQLPEMLRFAGAHALADQVDTAAVRAVLFDIEATARRAMGEVRR